MNQLDNPVICQLANYAANNGYRVDCSRSRYVIRVYYSGGNVVLFENIRGELIIINNVYGRPVRSDFGTEIDINEFERIFSRRVKGKR
ncbi:hypothetical protein LNU80_005071 [Salmonella enterica]|nr:hypothetical protein [Salmonella enterica]